MPHLDASAVIAAIIALVTGGLWLARTHFTANAAKDGVARIDAERKESKAEREREKAAYDKRLEKAEEHAGEIKALARSVSGLGDLMAMESKHNAERHEDLKREIQHARQNASMAKELASRRRGDADR